MFPRSHGSSAARNVAGAPFAVSWCPAFQAPREAARRTRQRALLHRPPAHCSRCDRRVPARCPGPPRGLSAAALSAAGECGRESCSPQCGTAKARTARDHRNASTCRPAATSPRPACPRRRGCCRSRGGSSRTASGRRPPAALGSPRLNRPGPRRLWHEAAAVPFSILPNVRRLMVLQTWRHCMPPQRLVTRVFSPESGAKMAQKEEGPPTP